MDSQKRSVTFWRAFIRRRDSEDDFARLRRAVPV